MKEIIKEKIIYHYSWILILSTLLSFTDKHAFNYCIGIMSIIGFFRFLRNPYEIINNKVQRFGVLLFLCIWLPMLLSIIDAVNFQHAVKTTLLYLHYIFGYSFAVKELQRSVVMRNIVSGSLLIVSFWCMDALAQYFYGNDFFGYPYRGSRMTGMFYPTLRMGHVLAVLSPIVFEAVRVWHKKNVFVWILPLLVLFMVLNSGNRVAWIMLIFSIVLYLLFLKLLIHKISKKNMILGIILPVAVMVGLFFQSQQFRDRVLDTKGLLSNQYELIDKASSYRISLWDVAIKMGSNNIVNGIGVRGYRHAFLAYAETDNYWAIKSPPGQTHPHQIMLEIFAETGLIGVVGFILFTIFFLLLIKQSIGKVESFRIAWIICVLIVILPLNANHAFYGSFWSSFLWWLIPIAVAGSSKVVSRF